MSQEQDKIFFRNYSIVLGILAVMIIVFLIAAMVLGKNEALVAERRSDDVSQRTRPVGDVRLAGEQAPGAETETEQQVAAADGDDGAKSGKDVYNSLCTSCHSTGLPGSPQMGDAEEWAPRIAKGKETLYDHAINGFNSGGTPMPPKGGNPALSDEEVKAAVDYMVANSQ